MMIGISGNCSKDQESLHAISTEIFVMPCQVFFWFFWLLPTRMNPGVRSSWYSVDIFIFAVIL